MFRSITLVATLIALTLSGCSVVEGRIDGTSVPTSSSFFIQDSSSGDDLIIIFVSSLTNACAVIEELEEDMDNAEDLDDLEAAWADNVPEDFWETRILMRVDDVDDSLSGETFHGVGWDEGLGDSGETYAAVSHYTEHLDLSDIDDWYEHWYSDRGTLDITMHQPDEHIVGAFDTSIADPGDGNSDGVVTIRFDARRCDGVERELF